MARLLWCFGSFTGRLPRKTFWAAAVSSLSGFLLGLQRSGATVEHVFDY